MQSISDALSEGKCSTGQRECGMLKQCIDAETPCFMDISPCPTGRTLCGNECVPDQYITDGYKKECGGECVLGSQVCKDGGEECSKRFKCGDTCIEKKYYEEYGYRECDGKCISGSDQCCKGTSVRSVLRTINRTVKQCCGDEYFICGRDCRYNRNIYCHDTNCASLEPTGKKIHISLVKMIVNTLQKHAKAYVLMGQSYVEMILVLSLEVGTTHTTESVGTNVFISLNSVRNKQTHVLQCTIHAAKKSTDDVLMTI